MDDSLSLTPPKSPVSEFMENTISSVKDVPYFSCQELSYLKSKLFGQYITLSLDEPEAPITVIFGRYFSSTSALWNSTHLFDGIKKNYCYVRALTIDNLDLHPGDSLSLIQNLRKDICSAFLFLLKSLQTFYNESISYDSSIFQNSEEVSRKSEVLSQVITQVKSLLLLVGRIINIPNILHVKDFKENTKIARYHYHYFHMCLDIWWNSTAVLHLVSRFPYDVNKREIFCCDLPQLDPFEQVISMIIVDLISLAFKQHEYLNSFSDFSPFKCKCIKEIWAMCIIMLEKKFSLKNDSFWAYYNRIIQDFCRSSDQLKAVQKSIYSFSLFGVEIQCRDTIVLCLWLTSHLSHLYKYDEWGYYDDLAVPKSGVVVVKSLINLIIGSNEVKENSLRDSLFYCIQMVSIWEPSCDIILPLTDYFIKNISETFLPKSDVISLSFLHSNTLDWYEKVIMFSAAGVSLNEFSSYELFLKMLSVLLSKSDGNLWRSLKGRVYSKFMPKKFKEFSEVALQNSYTLFLTIVHAGQGDIMKDVADKICELISIIETTGNLKKQMISWRAIFVLMHICQKKKFSLSLVISKISKFFIDACLNFHNTYRDTLKKNSIMSLIMIYIDGISDVFEKCKHLNLNEYELIGVDFSTLLLSCGISELNYILNVFFNILKNVQSSWKSGAENIIELQYVNFLNNFYANINPSIEKLILSDTPPRLIADISAFLVSLSYQFSTSLDSRMHNYSSMFVNFLNRDNVNIEVLCCFLSFIFDDDQLVNALKSNLDFSTIAFQSWLKCIVNLTPPCHQMDLLTLKILMQKEILELFPDAESLNFENGNYVYVSIAFFHVMGNHYDSLKTLQDRNTLKLKTQQYFKTLVPCVVSRMKKPLDISTLTHLYKITAHLVEHCSQLLHVRFNSDSILPQLLDQTVFPHLVFPKDKSMQSMMSCSIKEYLPNFLRGLLKLNYSDDKCIEREIKNIIVTYVGSYLLPNNPIAKMYLEYTVEKPDLLPFLLDIMKINVLLNNTSTKNGFLICFEMLKLGHLNHKKRICDVLLKCAFEIYMKHTGSFSDFLLNLVREVLVYLKNKVSVGDTKIFLMPVLEWFIQEKLQWSVARGFSVLNDVLDYIPDLYADTVPCLSKTVLELEKARGLGKDVLLRDHLQNIIRKHEKRLAK